MNHLITLYERNVTAKRCVCKIKFSKFDHMDKSHGTTDSWYYPKNDVKKVQGKKIFVTSHINYEKIPTI